MFDLAAGLSPLVISFRFPTITALFLPYRPYEKPYLVKCAGLFHQVAPQSIE
jgi:hypothetical protein